VEFTKMTPCLATILLDVGIGGLGVELGLDAGEELALLLGDAEALEGLLDVVRHLVPRALGLLALREVIADLVEIDVLEILRRPVRGHGFLEEGLEGLEAEIEDPRGLLLDGADVADGVLGQAGARVELVLRPCIEVALGLVDAGDGVDRLRRRSWVLDVGEVVSL
jgi:hypothetical protein